MRLYLGHRGMCGGSPQQRVGRAACHPLSPQPSAEQLSDRLHIFGRRCPVQRRSRALRSPQRAMRLRSSPPAAAMSSDSGEGIMCCKCGGGVLMDDLENPSKDKLLSGKKASLICRICGLNYKCLARRWKENVRLKTWWAQKSDDDRQAWYKEHKQLRGRQAAGAGGSDNVRIDFGIIEEEIKSVGLDLKRRRSWKCQSTWERDRCIEDQTFGLKSRVAKDQAWNSALLSEGVAK